MNIVLWATTIEWGFVSVKIGDVPGQAGIGIWRNERSSMDGGDSEILCWTQVHSVTAVSTVKEVYTIRPLDEAFNAVNGWNLKGTTIAYNFVCHNGWSFKNAAPGGSFQRPQLKELHQGWQSEILKQRKESFTVYPSRVKPCGKR